MPARIFFKTCVLTSVLLTGCSTVSQPPPGEPAPPASNTAAGESLPEPQEDIEYGAFSEDILTRVILAEMAGQRGYNRQALEEYESLARETGDLSIIKRASRIAAFLRDIPVSVEMADMWLEQEPDSIEAHQTLAFQMLSMGRYRQGLDHLVRLLELGSNVDFRVITSRTAADSDAVLFRDALISDFEDLLQEYPDNQSLRLSLAHLYQQNDQIQEAYDQVSQLSEDMNGAPEVVILEIQLLELLGEQRRADRRLQTSLREHPEHKQLRFLYAEKLIEEQRYDEARNQFSILVEQDPQDFEMLYSLALITLEVNRLNDAKRYFQRLVDNSERLNDSHYYLAYINEQENNPERAIEHYMQVEAGSNYLQAQRNLTELMVQRGRYQEARERLQRIRYTNPDYNIQLLTMEGSILIDAAMYDQAGTLLNSAVSAFPNDVQLLYLRSVLSQEVNDLDLMEQDLRKMIELNPNSPVAYNTLGYVLADRTGRYQEAYELIKRALDLSPNDPAIIDSMGWVQYRLGMYEEALESLDRAFELYPDHEVAAHLGEVLWVMGERDQASRIWRNALELQPDSEPIRDAMQRLTDDI